MVALGFHAPTRRKFMGIDDKFENAKDQTVGKVKGAAGDATEL